MSENQRDPQYKLRWSEELREKVAQSAKKHNRSMNADIIARLEKSFDDEDLPWLNGTNKEYLEKIKAIEEKLDQLIGTADNKKAP